MKSKRPSFQLLVANTISILIVVPKSFAWRRSCSVMVSTSDFESGSLGSIPSESVFVSMRPDAYLRRLGLFVASRPAHAALLLSRDEHNELLSLAAHVLAPAGSHLLRQELVQTVLGWFEDLSCTYSFAMTDFRQLLNQPKDTIHIEARARYALVSLFYCMIHDEAPVRQSPFKASETDSDSFSRLCEFLRTSLDEEEQIYWDNIVLFLCDTLAWVCNINITDDDADLSWIYSPASHSDIIITDSVLYPAFTNSNEVSNGPHLYFEQYSKLYNTVTYISRSVRGLYYHSLVALSSLRRAEHLMQISNITCRLFQSLSSVIVDECLSDSSNTVTFTMHTFTQNNYNMSKSRKLFRNHEALVMKLLGFATALGNAYAQALAGYYFIHAELYMIDATDEDMGLLEELISNLSEEIAVAIVRFTRAFLTEEEVQHNSETIVTWLLDTEFQSADGKHRHFTLTREYDLFRYDAFFYIMLGFISPIRSVCNYFTKEFDLHVYSFRNFVDTNAPLSCIPDFLLSRFSIRRPALGLSATPQMNFYDTFLDAYELRNSDDLDILLTEFKPSVQEPLENLATEPLPVRLLRFVLTSPYFNEAYSDASEATATSLSACMSYITPKYLAKSLADTSSVVLIGDFLAQTIGTYSNSIYLARFMQAAQVLDSKNGKLINVIKAWISIFRGLKLAQEYIINTHLLALFELTDMDSSQPFCIHESLILYNPILPSLVLVRASETSVSRQMNDVLAQVFGELLYSLGLASQTHNIPSTSLENPGSTQHILVPANTLIQEIYILISAVHDDRKNAWACSAIIDGLLYTLEAFTPLSNKYSYTDHCLLLDMILKYGNHGHMTSILSRFSALTAGSVTIADFIASIMSGHRNVGSLISNHILSFRHALVNLISVTNIIDIGAWARLLQNKHDLLQITCTEELSTDLADILYETLIDDLLCDDTYTHIIFDRRQSPQRLMQLPIFQCFPLEIVAAFFSDLLYLMAEESPCFLNIENPIKCSIDTENPFHFQHSALSVSLEPLLHAFIRSVESNSTPIDLQLLYSLDLFQTQCQEKKTIVFGSTPFHLQYLLHGILTLAEICAYLNNVTSSLPGFTDVSHYISLCEQSMVPGYSGIYSLDFHGSTKLARNGSEEKDASSAPTQELMDKWTQNTVDIVVHNPMLVDRLISIRSAIFVAGRELARQGSSLLIKLEMMLNMGTSGDFFHTRATHPPEPYKEDSLGGCDSDESYVRDITGIRLLTCFTQVTRIDFYDFNRDEKLHLLQYARTHNDFLLHYQQIAVLSDTILEDEEHYLWARNALENIISAGLTTFSSIPLADQTCYCSLLAFISGRPRDNAGEFMFSSSIDLYIASLALYSSFLVRLRYQEEKDDMTTPRRSVFLRIIYLLGNFLYLNFNPALRKTSKVFPSVLDRSKPLLYQKPFHFNNTDISEEVAFMSDWEETIAATTFTILLHILKKSLSNANNHTINILEWIAVISSETIEFFTPLISALYIFFKYLNQCRQSPTLFLSPDQSSYNSLIRTISIQSQLESVLYATIEAALSALTLPISGYIVGLKLPQYSLFINILETEKREAYKESNNPEKDISDEAITPKDGALTRAILKEIQGRHSSLKEKTACIRANISSLMMLSHRYAREQISTRFPEKIQLASMKVLPPHQVNEKPGHVISFFNTNDLLTLHAIRPLNSELLLHLIKIFPFPSSDVAVWGTILCAKNCGNALLKLLLKVFLTESQSLTQLPLPLIYLSRLSPDRDISILAEKCLSRCFGSNSWQPISPYLMNSYLAEADIFLSSLPKHEEHSSCKCGGCDIDFLSWIQDSFLRATAALFSTLKLQDDHKKSLGIPFSICQTLMKYIRSDRWKEYALRFVEDSDLGIGSYTYGSVGLDPSREQTALSLFEYMALDAIKSMSQDPVNVSVMLNKQLHKQLSMEAQESLCHLVLLYNPTEYMQHIVNEWTKEPEWCAFLLTYLGSPLHDLQRSLPIEIVFRSLFDFESIFRPWLNCPSVKHLLEFFNQIRETVLPMDSLDDIDSVDKIELSYIPKDLVSRIFEYQKNKCLFGLSIIITIVLSLYLSGEGMKRGLCKFQISALSLLSAALDFFYLDELKSGDSIENYSSLSGYLCYASVDTVTLIDKIATAAEYTSFLKLPSLRNQVLYYNFSPAHSVCYKQEPSLLQFLTTQPEVIAMQKRLKRSVTSISPKSIFISAFVSFLGKIQHTFNTSSLASISGIVPLIIAFYYDALVNRRVLSASASALAMEKVIQGVVGVYMSNSINRSHISITTTKTLVDILAIEAHDYALLGCSQYQFQPILQTLTCIFDRWDLMLLSPKSLKALLADLYAIPCLYPISDLSQKVGLLIFQILRLLKKMDTSVFQLQAAFASAALLCIGEVDAAIETLQSHGFSAVHEKESIKDCITEYIVSSPIEQAVLRLLDNNFN